VGHDWVSVIGRVIIQLPLNGGLRQSESPVNRCESLFAYEFSTPAYTIGRWLLCPMGHS